MIQRHEAGKTMSRAVVYGGLIHFCGHVAPGNTIKEQTKALLARYDELFAQYGTDKDHMISATLYISDLTLRDEMNEVWNEWISEGCAPARVCVEVGLPQDFLLEMSVVAAIK